jgi:hypothetical protein
MLELEGRPMTEAEWLRCEDPDILLDSPQCNDVRKRRLFACVCARGVVHFLKDSRFEDALRASEALADGAMRREQLADLQRAVAEAQEHLSGPDGSERERHAAAAIYWACEQRIPSHRRAANQSQFAVGADAGVTRRSAMAVEVTRQAAMVRDIFGNPFRPATLDPSWLTPTVTALARQMYESRDFGAMPILADALQDAGCDSAAILDHCRGPGPHVRGCWVVDLVLGKE